jgi:hypothetical protein
MIEPNELTAMQRMQVGEVYAALARLLPIEGTDYTLSVKFNENGSSTLGMTGLTDFGKQWAAHCMAQLPRMLGSQTKG